MAVQASFVSTKYSRSIFLTVVTKSSIVTKAANGNHVAGGYSHRQASAAMPHFECRAMLLILARTFS